MYLPAKPKIINNDKDGKTFHNTSEIKQGLSNGNKPNIFWSPTCKSAKATCVKIATEIKKNVLHWKKCPISIFSKIFIPYKHILAALFRK